ncbi:PQQ-binding-like beta-propeller repeat protein [Halobacteria archaeon AArc-dxtr1]|nr:PQQ-binding-like beta-propeller repeat protein [Halobacteria archaeon AArc-dxtr1]
MTGNRFSRRRLLASVGTGVSALVAGCGYQPAGGELDWVADADGSVHETQGFGSVDDLAWRSDGTSLYRIRNRSNVMFADDGTAVTVSDARADTVWSVGDERFYEGRPAVADGRVFLSLEDGSIVAFEHAESTADADGPDDTATEDGEIDFSRGDDGAVDWRTRYDGPPLSLVTDGDLLVGTNDDQAVGYEATTGDERFTLSFSDGLGPAGVDDVAVAGGRTWLLAGDELFGLDPDGTVGVERSLPATGRWLTATDAAAVLSVDDELWTVDPDGDRTLATEIDVTGTPAAVPSQDRLYHAGSDTLTAVDTEDGAVAWVRDISFRTGPVADSDGIYGVVNATDSAGCELTAFSTSGERRWAVPSLAELGCSFDLFVVDDRLVGVGEDSLYGIRREPGPRLSVH